MIAGAGIGLRSYHYDAILSHHPNIPWFEVLADNYMVEGGPGLAYLDEICAHYPVVLHGVGLSLGSTDPLDMGYLKKLTQLSERTKAAWVSEHLSWGAHANQHYHDLLPLPFTHEVIDHLVDRIKQVQDVLQVPFLVENISTYGEFCQSTMPEHVYTTAIIEQADCGLLLDVNNLYVNACNHGFDPIAYLDALPKTRVMQIHLAGYDDRETHLYDNHGAQVHAPVWALYQQAIKRLGPVPTLIEWDNDIPSLSALMKEAEKAEAMLNQVEVKKVGKAIA